MDFSLGKFNSNEKKMSIALFNIRITNGMHTYMHTNPNTSANAHIYIQYMPVIDESLQHALFTVRTVTEKSKWNKRHVYENVLVQNLVMTLNILMAIQACEPALRFVVNMHTYQRTRIHPYIQRLSFAVEKSQHLFCLKCIQCSRMEIQPGNSLSYFQTNCAHSFQMNSWFFFFR